MKPLKSGDAEGGGDGGGGGGADGGGRGGGSEGDRRAGTVASKAVETRNTVGTVCPPGASAVPKTDCACAGVLR